MTQHPHGDGAAETSDVEGAVESSVPPEASPSVLVFTSHRSAELVVPLRETDLNATVVEVNSSGSLPARSLETVRRTRAAIEAGDPDVILLDCYEVMGTLVTLFARWNDVPIIARLVGDTWQRFENAIREERSNGSYHRALFYRGILSMDDFAFDRAVGFVVVSTQLGEVVQQRTGCPPERIGIVPVPDTGMVGEPASRVDGNGSSGEHGSTGGGRPSDPRERFGIDSERVLLTVTNLKYRAKYRGIEEILSAVEPVLAENPEVAYVVAGGGEYAEKLEANLDAIVDDPDVRDRIHVVGYVTDVASLYEIADVFVYVSYLDGYPRVVLEAQRAGVPVVANDAFGMREQIVDGESGFLVDPSEHGQLADRVEFLLENDDERRRHGRRGRERVARENSPDVVGRRLEAFVREVYAGFDHEP